MNGAPDDADGGYPIPDPPEQNPSEWHDAKLRLYGLPPKPREWHARPYKAWMQAFGRKLRFIPGVPIALELETLNLVTSAQDVPQAMLTRQTSRFLDSPNWSGAFLEATCDRTFTQVFGRWNIPPAKIPSGGQEPLYRCASWIGIDGQRHYRDATLPQVGTVQTVTMESGEPTLKMGAWTQWWVPNDRRAGPRAFRDFPVRVGDKIQAVLTVLDEHSALCNLVNEGTSPPTFVARKLHAPTVVSRDGTAGATTQRYSISGATVSWIQERSTDLRDASRLVPLADFGEVSFSSCLAVQSRAGGVDPMARTLGTARYIRLFEVRHGPERTAYISMPDRDDENGFVAHYGDFWRGRAPL